MNIFCLKLKIKKKVSTFKNLSILKPNYIDFILKDK
jgi:hypothetical protein